MEFVRQYAIATEVHLPMVKRGVVDYAVGVDWTPAAGDVKIRIDGGAAANINTLPVAFAMGNTAYWNFALSAAEMTGKKITVTVGDSAAKAVEDQIFDVVTNGHTSAEQLTSLYIPQYVGVFQAGGDVNSAVLEANTPDAKARPGDIVRKLNGTYAGQEIEIASSAGMGGASPTVTALAGQTWTAPSAGEIYAIIKKGGTVSALATDFWNSTSRTLSSDGVQALFNSVFTESYAAVGAAPTFAQLCMFLQQMLSSARVVGNTMTIYALDGITPVRTLTLNAAYPATLPTAIVPAT